MIRFSPTHIVSALAVITTEYEWFTAEQDAFAAFHHRLNEIDPKTTPEPWRPHADAHVLPATSAAPLQDQYLTKLAN